MIDVHSHRVHIEAQRTKEDGQIAQGLMRCWKTMGMPDFLQLDNELSFRGSNRHPRSFGIVIRLCLLYGITPVFIPVGEPWRNGIVERFNDTYNDKFFRRQWFPSYAALKRQSKNFQRFHNKHHRYSCLQGKTPLEVLQKDDYTPTTLAAATKIPIIDYIPDGVIILIRFIRSDCLLDVFGEKFRVLKDIVYSYVRAEIVTAHHCIRVYSGDEYVSSFDYDLPTEIT